RAASRVVGVRRSGVLTSSSVFGCVWPRRLVAKRRPLARAVTATMLRTTLRSSFQRCSEQRPCSVDTVYFAARRSKRTLPSSSTAASLCSARNSAIAAAICSGDCKAELSAEEARCGGMVAAYHPSHGKALPPSLCAQVRNMRDMMAAMPRVEHRNDIKPLHSALTVIPRTVPLWTLHRAQQRNPARMHALQKIDRPLNGHLMIRQLGERGFVVSLDRRHILRQRTAQAVECCDV